MKTKKIINIILMIIVMLIWSTLGYRFFYSSNEVLPVQFPTVEFESKESFRFEIRGRDIVLSDKDAFGKYKTPNKHIRDKPTIPLKKKPKVSVIEDNPNRISFHGSLTDQNGKKIYIIKLNGQIKRMSIGQKIGNVTIIKPIENGIQILDRKEKREVFEILPDHGNR